MPDDNNSAPLNVEKIRSVCLSNGCDIDVVVLQSVESTNTWLMQRPQNDGQAINQAKDKNTTNRTSIQLCAAEHQTVGRGRRGKTWHTPAAGVTFSIRIDSSAPVASFNGLSLLVGANLCDRLRAAGAQAAMLKWPNDILVGDAKLAGILIETSVQSSSADKPGNGGTTIVIGVGINYQRGAEASSIDQRSTDLYDICAGVLPDRSMLIGDIAAHVIASVESDVPSAVRDLAAHWSRYDALANCELTVATPNGEVNGLAAGIDPTGSLLVSVDGDTVAYTSAEVSVRRG